MAVLLLPLGLTPPTGSELMTFLRLMASLTVVCGILIRPVATQEAAQNHLFGTTVPESDDIGPDDPVNVGVRFTATQNGVIAGIRFYKSLANVGPHLGRLWSSDGVMLASVTFSNETASGWQEARLRSLSRSRPEQPTSLPIALPPVTWRSPRTTSSSRRAIIRSSRRRVRRPRRTACIRTEDDELPTLSYRDSNFWVDVTFETTTSDAPTVIGVHPVDGAINATAPVEATFNVDMDPASVVFRLSRPDGTFVAGTVTYDAARRTARLTPERSLLGSTRYSASISARATSGLTMASPHAWSFTTGAVGFRDTVVMSGLTSPTTFRFAPGGFVFVAEKSGIIKVFEGFGDSSPLIFADLRTQVFNYWDRGLLGLALDPGFPAEPYLYVAYAHDARIGGVAPLYGEPDQTSDSVCERNRMHHQRARVAVDRSGGSRRICDGRSGTRARRRVGPAVSQPFDWQPRVRRGRRPVCHGWRGRILFSRRLRTTRRSTQSARRYANAGRHRALCAFRRRRGRCAARAATARVAVPSCSTAWC